MKKDNRLTAVIMLNMIILALFTLNKKYKPLLDKLSKQYITLKNENKTGKSTTNYKKETRKILEEAKTKIGDLGNLVQEALTTYTISGTQKYEMISTEMPFSLKTLTTELSIVDIPFGNSIDLVQTDDILSTEALSKSLKNPSIFRGLCGTIALILALNSWEITNTKDASNYLDSYIMEDLEDLFSNTKDDDILTSPNVVELTEINTPCSLEQQMETILTSNMSYEEKWNQILILDGITLDQSMLTIINCNVSNEIILQFIVKTDKLTVKQKVWYALLLPNVPFQKVLNELLTINATQDQIIEIIIDMDMVPFETLFNTILKQGSFTNEQFIHYLVAYHADYNIVSINEMIHYILSLESFTKEEQINCIWSLLEDYSLNKKITTILNYYNMTYEDFLNLYAVKNNLTEEQNIVWNLMERVNIEKEEYILEHCGFESKEQLDETIAICAAEAAKDYRDIYGVVCTVFNRSSNPHFIQLYGTNPYLQVTAKSQFVVYESGSYLLYLYPRDSRSQDQYDYAKQAVLDVFYWGQDVVAHNYVQFRSWDTETFSDIYIVNGGNRYNTPIDPDNQIKYEYNEDTDDINYDWVKKLRF